MPNQKPLAGVRVLDFTWYAAGPAATKLLAANGAEVIKVESLDRPDATRTMQPHGPGMKTPNSSLYFNNMNTDKYSVSLNLSNPRGLKLAKRLVAVSDLVISNFSPRAIDKLGLDYESLKLIRDDVIVVHLPILGLTGTRRHYAGLGTGLKGFSGLSSLMGFEGTIPVGPQGAYPDFGINPSHAAFACVAALYARRRTGRGQSIDMSQYESMINVTGTAVLEYMLNGRVPPRQGNRHRNMAPHGVYPCAGDDQWVVIAVGSDDDWRRLCDVLDRQEWREDERFRSFVGRIEHQDELDRALEEWTRSRSPKEAAEALQAKGVPAYEARTVEGLFEHDAQMIAREHYAWVEHPELGHTPVDRPAFRFQQFSAAPERAAPLIGEHSDYVLRELLQLSVQEVNDLILDGVVALG